MQVFYPFVLLYMVASYLQGGIGTSSMGLLSNVRQWLWIPVFQTAFRCPPLASSCTSHPSTTVSAAGCDSLAAMLLSVLALQP